MSWSAQYDSYEDLKNDKRTYDGSASNVAMAGITDEVERAIAAARQAAISLIGSGAYGDPERYQFYIYLSGHANPRNEPQPKWSTDCTTVSVSQKMP